MFNREAFLEDVKRIHSLTDELPDIDVRRRLDEVIDYDKLLFSKALDDICNNVVGDTMFRLLMTKKPPGMRLRIIDIGPEQARTRKPLINQEGSSYSHTTYAVKVNLNVYDRGGIGIPDRQYYCMDERGNITLKPKSLSASIFHEFTHCLHHIEDAVRYDVDRHFAVPEPWHNKEELRTISGYIEPDVFDPICDNCFDLYESVSRHIQVRPTIVRPVPCAALSKQILYRSLMHRKVLQPMVKVVPYRPRLGHIGYVKGKSEYSYEDLLQYHRCLNFDLAWPRKYM